MADKALTSPTADTASTADVVAKSQHHLMVLQMAAGAGSGAVTKTATAPLERIKIIFQIQVSSTQSPLGHMPRH